MTPFSNRARHDAPLNRWTVAREAHRGPLLDLTNSNPTRAALPYPLDELSAAMARAAREPYSPDPRGLPSAREALADELSCDAGELLLTASTSEAYSFLFKLLCDPGDEVVTATPSYPLIEHLAALELIELRHFPLEFHRRWELDRERIAEAIGGRTRAIVVVNPNNPTGSYVTPHEQEELASFGLPIISDEVFHPFAFAAAPPSIVRGDVLTFTLGGLSKSAGLPHFKLGWIRVSGPPAARRDALAALELIADNFLSVSTPVQAALPELLPIGRTIREGIMARTRASLAALGQALAKKPHAQLLPVEGGWSAVVRVPHLGTDEDFALQALERGVVVQPGYFFDFDREGYFVVSLLTEPEVMREGIARIV
jgi:aspartate/methionine/tyrosine aminotransferase